MSLSIFIDMISESLIFIINELIHLFFPPCPSRPLLLLFSPLSSLFAIMNFSNAHTAMLILHMKLSNEYLPFFIWISLHANISFSNITSCNNNNVQ